MFVFLTFNNYAALSDYLSCRVELLKSLNRSLYYFRFTIGTNSILCHNTGCILVFCCFQADISYRQCFSRGSHNTNGQQVFLVSLVDDFFCLWNCVLCARGCAVSDIASCEHNTITRLCSSLCGLTNGLFVSFVR